MPGALRLERAALATRFIPKVSVGGDDGGYSFVLLKHLSCPAYGGGRVVHFPRHLPLQRQVKEIPSSGRKELEVVFARIVRPAVPGVGCVPLWAKVTEVVVERRIHIR